MHSHIFLDESGDLGWKLNSPYRNGGSSKFLTISYLISPITDIHLPRRIAFKKPDPIQVQELQQTNNILQKQAKTLDSLLQRLNLYRKTDSLNR